MWRAGGGGTTDTLDRAVHRQYPPLQHAWRQGRAERHLGTIASRRHPDYPDLLQRRHDLSGGSIQPGGGHELVVINNASAPSAIDSTIVDGTSATSLTISGGGVTILPRTNTFTGVTQVAGGTLDLTNSAALLE